MVGKEQIHDITISVRDRLVLGNDKKFRVTLNSHTDTPTTQEVTPTEHIILTTEQRIAHRDKSEERRIYSKEYNNGDEMWSDNLRHISIAKRRLGQIFAGSFSTIVIGLAAGYAGYKEQNPDQIITGTTLLSGGVALSRPFRSAGELYQRRRAERNAMKVMISALGSSKS